MSSAVINIFKIPDLRKRVLFTLFMLIVYRIGAHIPVPGINVEALRDYFVEAEKSGVLDFFDLFAGGALKRFTIFALGIMPYISSSIIVDLLKTVFPYLNELSKEGAEGYKKLNQYIKYGTVLLCTIQGLGLVFWMRSMRTADGTPVVPDGSGVGFTIMAVISIVTGTMVLMWFGELITERGIGNGISLIIMAGIVVRLPQSFYETMKKIADTGEPIVGIILIGLFFLVVAASILLTLGTRRIPVQYGKRMVGATAVQRTAQYIPLRVNAAGVIPIIFASAIIVFPSQLVRMLGVSTNVYLNKIQYWLTPGQIPYIVLYSALVIFFCFFYTSLRFNPTEIADNLKKYGGFIPGIRPGQNTADYLMGVLNRVTLSGSIFLALISIIPDFIIRIWPEQVPINMAYLFGGTSLLIVVGVALDTLKQIESQLLMRHYDGFLGSKKKIQGRY
ncbi:MAG: preprotein translocase subunit SecY [Spirochaetes bacterium ADurb.Bin218]|jgi:preprotein translocase subunit SecY|nr:preprotein translocase subunit SecY [Spirochaetota bacterium]OQB00384.1 MAG: preprotein translocase subunit SecY [Spirochaetes bacterium ADurb.Bin218]HOQ10754.1 preprotein translocase subunit SecY [Spirochaetota bacterium]HOV08287.1 preprotein translocase subunit SecY [Spirochaetota bacterium]HPX90605.1 preprotein translocase subunit SecY [Spirochaetota bacterium]